MLSEYNITEYWRPSTDHMCAQHKSIFVLNEEEYEKKSEITAYPDALKSLILTRFHKIRLRNVWTKIKFPKIKLSIKIKINFKLYGLPVALIITQKKMARFWCVSLGFDVNSLVFLTNEHFTFFLNGQRAAHSIRTNSTHHANKQHHQRAIRWNDAQ